MRVSREINGFINNLVACLSLASFHRRGYRVLNSYYVGGEWKPCRRRQDGRGARVEGVRKGGRGIRYRLKGDSMADFHFWTFFFEPPSFERALASAFPPPLPRKEKSGGTMVASPRTTWTSSRHLIGHWRFLFHLETTRVMGGKRNIRVIYSVLASSRRRKDWRILEGNRFFLSFEERNGRGLLNERSEKKSNSV